MKYDTKIRRPPLQPLRRGREGGEGAHDRFLIVDSTVYHIGASLKDLGKSLFAFSKLVTPAATIMAKLP